MLIHVPAMEEMKVPLMKVILMVIVSDEGVTTSGAVHMEMFFMNAVFAHGPSFHDDGCSFPDINCISV
jgi:hypothetical protein